jgi:hypothetical protein
MTGQFVRVAEGVRAPKKFLVVVDEPTYSAQLEAEMGPYGQPRCTSFRLAMLDGSAINWETLHRVPLANWLEVGTTHVLEERVVGEFGPTNTWMPISRKTPSAERDAMLERLRRSVIDGSSSRRPLSHEFLAAVADIYKAAGSKPIAALEKAFPEHKRSTINKWVKRCRDLGLLPPAKYTRREKGGRDGD